ncbi:MAG: hypothetical protein Q8Q44_15750, partial [Nocardioides sp.]|nr:hypothetical protein [Nocardioides sp.]
MQKFIEQFKKEIESFAPSARPENGGVVTRVSDGVAEIEGLEKAVMSEMIRFETAHGKQLKDAVESHGDVYGVILNLEEGNVRAIILGDVGRVAEG